MNPLVKFSAVRKQQAEQVLTGGDVIKTLSRYGSPLIVGSYALDVMYDPDIDIVVLTKNPWKSSLDALHDFISQRKFQKYEYGDFVKFRRPGNPEGFIVNLRTKTSTISWEVEIWFLKSITRDKTFTTALLEKLDTKNDSRSSD